MDLDISEEISQNRQALYHLLNIQTQEGKTFELGFYYIYKVEDVSLYLLFWEQSGVLHLDESFVVKVCHQTTIVEGPV